MAQWGSARWDASYWDAVVGVMAATETGTDTFAAEGDVIVTGTMAATETGVDTFSAEGTVEVTGSMAAVETGVDVFAATGSVAVQGSMAAVETGVDVFAATGTVAVQGTMAATETGVDTFAATGDVEDTGVMAAVETGVDVFAATGEVITPTGVTGDMAAVETGEDTFLATGTVQPQPIPQPVIADVGDERQRKRAQKKRDEAFEKYRQEQAKLREDIERAVDPVKTQTAPVVVSRTKKQVEVLAVDGSKIDINVPLAFSAEEVARLVGEVLESAKVAAMQVQRQQDAQRALEIARAELARIIKRKRDDEAILLLMD